MSQEKIESPDKKLIQHSESKKAMNGFQGSIVCAIILGFMGLWLPGRIRDISLQLQAEQGSPHILHCGRNILEIRRKLSMGTSRFLKLWKMRSGYMELRGLEKNSDRLIKRLL